MDTELTTTAVRDQRWELLAHLTLTAQTASHQLEPVVSRQSLHGLLQHYLADLPGVIITDGEAPTVYLAWGMDASQADGLLQAWQAAPTGAATQFASFPFTASANGTSRRGVLVLHPAVILTASDELYLRALSVQLGTLLATAHEPPNPAISTVAELELISNLAQAAATAYNLTTWITDAYRACSALLSADTYRVAIYYSDANPQELCFTARPDDIVTYSSPPRPQAGSPEAVLAQTNQPYRWQTTEADQVQYHLGVPLIIGHYQNVGHMILSRAARAYSDHELALLHSIALQVALGVQSIKLQLQVEEQILQLSLLNFVSSVAASSGTTQEIYYAAIESMVQITAADQARVFFFDQDQQGFVEVSEYIPTAHPKRIVIPINANPLVAWLEQHRVPFASYDAQSDPVLAPVHAILDSLQIASIAYIPLVLNDNLLGLISLSVYDERRNFNPQHLAYCQTLANTVVTVIDKERLFEDAKQNAEALHVKVGELSTLLEAAGILGSLLRPKEVLDSLIDLVRRQLQVTTVALWTMGSDQILTPAAIYGIALEALTTMRVPFGRGLTGYVAKTGEPLRITDVQGHGGALFNDIRTADGSQAPLASYMGVPLLYRDQVIGVLSVMSTHEREFSEDEMQLLIALGRQAAVALENARLFQERERRINQLSAINQISADVTATLNLDELLLTLQRGIGNVLDNRQSYIGLFEDTTLDVAEYTVQLRVIQQGDTPHLSDATVVIDGAGLIDYVMLRSEALLLETPEMIEAHLDEWSSQYGVARERMRRSPINTHFASMLAVPIMQGRDLQGIIGIESQQPYAFTYDDLQFLSTIASQAAAAIASARLLQERERRLREMSVLKDIGAALSTSLDLPTVLERLRLELGQAVDVSTSVIALYDPELDMLSYPVAFERGNRVYLAPIELDNDVNGWVIRNRQPLLILSPEQARQIGFDDSLLSLFEMRSGQTGQRLASSQVPQSLLVVPIITGDHVLGVINIQSYTPRAFDNDDLRFVTTVANQAAASIANISLFIERGRRLEELTIFNEIGRELSATVSSDELMALIKRQIGRLIDTSNLYIVLLDEDRRMLSFPLFYERGERQQIAPIPLHDSEGSYLRSLSSIPRWPVLVRLTRHALHSPEPLLVQGEALITDGWLVELPSEMRSAQRTKPFAWLGVPLVVADRVIGLIVVRNYDLAVAYSSDDVRILSTIASSAAIALENARLFEQTSKLAADLEIRVAERTRELAAANTQLVDEKERLETVHAITLELTALLDLDEIIGRALEMTSANLIVSRGSIMLRDPQTGELLCRALLQEQGMVNRVNFPITFQGGDSLAHWVINNRKPVRIGDVRLDPRWTVAEGRAEETRSVIAVPLQTTDNILGVLMLNSPRINYFTESQLRLLETVANEIAITINNALLYGYINEMATQLATKMEEERLANSKNDAVFQSMTEGVIVLNQNKMIDAFNLAAEQMLGIPAAAVKHKTLDAIALYGETEAARKRGAVILETLRTGLQTAKERKNIFRTTFELENPTQTISVSLSAIQSRSGENYGDVAVLRDITLEIEADRAKRQFVSGVSHELRTPLTAIGGYVDLLMLGTGGPLNEQQKELLNVVKSNVRRLRSLVDDILEISRFEAGKIDLVFKPISVAEIIRDVDQSLRLEAERKRMQVTLEVQPNLPSVIADEKRITQVITNLFSNAIKYTYEGGTIVVRAFLNPANLLQVEIEDNGVGLSPAQQQKLFRPFYRAFNPLSEQAGGTGLGLLITKSLVEQHGGELWVTSEQGKGSVFHFVLPLEQDLRQHTGNEQEDAT